jgi:hypothetical protein
MSFYTTLRGPERESKKPEQSHAKRNISRRPMSGGANMQAIVMNVGTPCDIDDVINRFNFGTDQLFMFLSYEGSESGITP